MQKTYNSDGVERVFEIANMKKSREVSQPYNQSRTCSLLKQVACLHKLNRAFRKKVISEEQNTADYICHLYNNHGIQLHFFYSWLTFATDIDIQRENAEKESTLHC